MSDRGGDGEGDGVLVCRNPGSVDDGRPEWPPPTIKRWLAGKTVSTDVLAAELRTWAAWAESPFAPPSPPSPLPLVWRRLADEWPEDTEDGVTRVWVYVEDDDYVTLEFVHHGDHGRFIDDGNFYARENGSASNVGLWWLPAAVPTPPADTATSTTTSTNGEPT